MFNISRNPEMHGLACLRQSPAAFAIAFVLAAALLAFGAPIEAFAQAGCPGSPVGVGSPQFPTYTNSIANRGVVTGDHYVYFLSYYGFVRVDISNPGNPVNPQLAQVGYDRGLPGGGGGKVVVDCDCHGGGQVIAAAESPTGDSRAISDWAPAQQNGGGQLPYQVGTGAGGNFAFGQQVNGLATSQLGSDPLAAIYLPGAGKFLAYVPTGLGFVQTFDLTATNGQTGQTCTNLQKCVSYPALGIQPISQALAWNFSPGGGLWAGTATMGGVTTYFLVGSAGGVLRVATIDPSTGIPTEIGTVHYSFIPDDMAIATVKGSAYIFSAEDSSGIEVYEIRGPNNIVKVQQPAAFVARYTKMVVKAPSSSSPTPIIFSHRESGGSHIDIYDTNWLIPGSSTPIQQPRLGASLPHLGSQPLGPSGPTVTSNSFGAKVVQNGAVVDAYVFEVVGTFPQPSVASTMKDVSCIAADPTAPAVASFQMTNVSAASRQAPENGKNYYGDRWRIQDTSSTGVPLTFLQWDLIATDTSTTYLDPDVLNWPNPPTYAMLAPGAPGSVPATLEFLDGGAGNGTGPGISWPCDPSVLSADPVSGHGCWASIGQPTLPLPWDIKIQVENQNPAGAPTPSIAAQSQSVQAPTVYVNGQTGSPAIPNPINVLTGQGVLTVLGAPASQGNTTDATFTWTFLPSGGQTGTTVNPVPGNAVSFSLLATYRDGFQTTVTGQINQTDLVAAFGLQSSTVVTPGALTVINLMQKANSATLNNVMYVVNQGATLIASGTLAPSFNSVNGTATVTAPPVGSYTITLTYNYTSVINGAQQQTPPAQPFTTTNWVPVPLIGIFYDAGATQLVNCQFGCNLIQSTTYHLADTEVLPPSVSYPGANFYTFAAGTDTFLASTGPFVSPPAGGSDPATVPFTPLALCATGCYLHALVGGNSIPPATDSQHLIFTVASSAQPLSASVHGPTNGSVGVPVTFSASASGGVPPYSYQWACQYSPQFPGFTAGGATTSCTYPGANTYQVAVKVTDSQSAVVLSAPVSIVIGGGGGGGLAVAVSGPGTAPPKTSVTFTASASGGTGAYTFTWTPGESPFDVPQSTGATPTYSHTYNASATYTVTCTVTSGTSTAQGTTTVVITPPVTPGPLATYTISGATLGSGAYDVSSGQAVTFAALEIPANVAATNGYTWDFNDGFPKHTQQVVYSFGSVGAQTVTLTVQGDGVNRIGTATSTIQFNVTPPAFQAMLVPSAEHSAPVLDPSGVLKFWATDVSVANAGTVPITISPAFLSFSASNGLTFDLSTVTFDAAQTVTIPVGGQQSWVDMVKVLEGDVANKGTLILKYDGGNATPLVTARIYFAPVSDPTGPASGSALPSFRATTDGQVIPQGAPVLPEQDLAGLRGDASYYFRLTLFNSGAIGGTFHISAVDDRGFPVNMLNPSTQQPSPGGLDFAIGPYQAIDWSNDSLGLNDPARRYVLKAHRTSSDGILVASAAVRDRFTRDEVLVTSDSPPAFAQTCSGAAGTCVNYIVPGASRFQSASGARWRTGLSVYNSASLTTRGVAFEYHYQDTSLVNPEQIALGFQILQPGQLIFFDDLIAQMFATVGNNLADPNNGTAGILKIIHFVDGETDTAPLIFSARNYDDQPTGTVGTELSVYTEPLSLGPNEPSLLLAGAEADGGSNPDPRFETILAVFSFDDTQTAVRLTAVRSDGTVLGFTDVVLNQPGVSGHFQPRNLNISDFNALINEPITVKVDVLSGGRVGAYALLRDLVSRDPTYIQATPQSQN